MAAASLVLGILSIVLSFFFNNPIGAKLILALIPIIMGIAGIILAATAKKKGASGPATGGLVCAIIGTVFSVIHFAICASIACAANKGIQAIGDALEESGWEVEY